MGSWEKILIVEDDEEWRGIYERAVRDAGSEAGFAHEIEVAEDLDSADRLIDATKFAVAIVDVGLDVEVDGNIDGLKVMAKIRSMDDETSIIVVTGRSGQDVLEITRNALKDHNAFDTVSKSSVTPSKISELVAEGLVSYRKAAAASRERAGGRRAVGDELRGEVPSMNWDDRVMRATEFRSSALNFYDFLNGLLGRYLPLVHRPEEQPVTVDSSLGLVHGDFWSRAIGAAIVVCFGAEASFDQAIGEARAEGKLLGRYPIGRQLTEPAATAPGVGGAVFLLAAGRREDYGGKRIEWP